MNKTHPKKDVVLEYRKTGVLIPYARNSRTHSEAQVQQIASSIKEFGFTNPVLIDEENGIIAGHGSVQAAQLLGMDEVPCIVLSGLSEAKKRAYIIADNKLALNAGWNDEMLRLEFEDLKAMDFDLDLTGFSADEIGELLKEENEGELKKGSLSDRFLIPPFSVLNAREGWWQDRKRGWLSLGIKSEEGRNIKPTNISKNQPAYMAGRGNNDGGSIFDAVLCELVYSWFCPSNGVILDPFAGGSVRGIVAAKLGRQYIGGELRAEQVEANRKQADTICDGDEHCPVWHCADSRFIDKTAEGVQADIVFSCPPYADLEVYSDDKADISNPSIR